MDKMDIKNFEDMVDSLRQFRRYELLDDRKRDLIEDVYVDPMESDGLLELCKKDNTTVLVGRKGTGKSTIFMRMQHELRKNNEIMTCYVDVKDLFDRSRRNYESIKYLTGTNEEEIETYSLQRQFIINFLKELILEIEKNYQTITKKIGFVLKGVNSKKAIENLKTIQQRLENNNHLAEIELTSLSSMDLTSESNDKISSNQAVGMRLASNGGDLELSSQSSVENIKSMEKKYNRVFAKIFEIDSIIEDIKKVLQELKMKRLFIVLDDYSEIDQRALRMFSSLIVNSLNNNSGNFIKLKISAYPGRVELGELDRQKIDIKNIDYYDLYSKEKANDREKVAMSYTGRILNKRLEVYTGKNMDYFFDTDKVPVEEYYKTIFNMSMNVVRHIGLLLLNAQESSIRIGNKITIADLNDASKKMYNERLYPFFEEPASAQMSYKERIDIIQLEKLLDEFIRKEKHIKTLITTGEYSATIFDNTRGNPFTSHFSILQSNEKYIETLELNFFISKYSEMVSKKGEKVSIYALNYGLCLNQNIRWGKPDGNEQRTYFILSQFNFNTILISFMEQSRVLKCELCKHKYSEDEYRVLKSLGTDCVKCQGKIKEFAVLSESEKEQLQQLEEADLLEPELAYFLKLVNLNGGSVSNREMCIELSYKRQKVGHLAKPLIDDNYLSKKYEDNQRMIYTLTEKGIEYLKI